MNSQALTQLATSLQGSLVTPEEDGYADVRRIWNGIVEKTPSVIVTCNCVEDVVSAVNFAREHSLHVSVRGGGHHVAGSSLIHDGLVIDMSGMRSVRVDPQTQRVLAEGGALIGDLDPATQAHNLAVPMGLVSETGIAGLTLGGGAGWLRRKHGLSCDAIVSAEVVLSDGRQVHASADENADLLWALRGAGWDFGVVTSFEFEAYPLGPEVFLAFVTYPLTEGAQVLRRFREVMAGAPPEMAPLAVCWTFPEAEVFPRELWGQQFVAVVGPYAGSVEDGEKAMQPLRELGTVLTDMSGAAPFLEVQKFFDEDYPKGRRYYWRSSFLSDLSDGAIEATLQLADSRPSALSSVDIWPMGGAIRDLGAADSPFDHRDAAYMIGIEANWDEPASDAANIAWARRSVDAYQPHSTGGSYMNFEDPDDTRATAAAYGASLQRLIEVKRKYDPANLFRSRKGLAG